MIRDIIIGIDAGTSVIKAVAFQVDGTQVGVFAIPNTFTRLPNGGVEQDMERTWNDTAAALRGLAGRVPALAQRATGLAVTAQGDGTWLIDDDGRPIGPALLWLDARAGSICDTLRGSDRERRVFARTRTGLSSCLQSMQLLWLKQHRPDMIERAATAFHCKDWLYFKLTGERASDPSEGILTFGDTTTRDLDKRVFDDLGLNAEARLVSPITDGLRKTGQLTTFAARQTGLPEGLPIVLGYIDIVTTALGAGLFDREFESGCTVIGSTGVHMRLAQTAGDLRDSLDRSGYTIAFPMGQSYAQLQSNMASTLNLDWIIDVARDILNVCNIAISRDEFLSSLDDRVFAAAPGTLLYHPYISEAGERGPFINTEARAQFVGLTVRHRFNDLLRAVVEGLAFAARDCYTAMGTIPSEVRVSGGATRSAALRQILAAVLNSKVRTTTREEAGAAGAAMIAAVSLGFFTDMETCTDRWTTPLLEPAIQPDRQLAETYQRLFPTYIAARHASTPVWRALGDIRNDSSSGRRPSRVASAP